MLSSPTTNAPAGLWLGKYSGTVVDNRDEQNRGRLQVTVPAVFGSVPPSAPGQLPQPPDEGPPVWATPCLPYGHFYIPPIGAKVWAEFEGGHVEHPIWVGVWYPSGTVPAVAAIKPPDNRVIQTVSGHTVEISDKAGDEHILIRHKGNGFVSIDHEGSVTIASQNGSFLSMSVADDNVTLVDKNANRITLSAEGAVMVSKGGVAVHLTDTDTAHIIAPKILLDSAAVAVGRDAAEPTLLGSTFLAQFDLHVHPHPLGPTLPPAVPLTPLATTVCTSVVTVK
jgi:hypothetical protein